MALPQEFIEKVIASTNIVDLISQHTTLKKSGKDFTGLCPFPDHREKTASFSVSDTRQAYYCFGCKRGGNAITFLEQMRGMSFRETMEFLAARANIPMPEEEGGFRGPQNTDTKKLFFKVNRFAAAFYHERLNALPANHPVRGYLKTRGLSEETIRDFRLGVASAEWSELVTHLERAGAPIDLAEKVGLVRKRGSGNGYYDLFRERLMFPILSPAGEVLGFGGRVLGDGNPKYLNSPESPVFHKGRVLYGLHESAKFIRTEDCVVVVEGYMDFLGLYQAGITNVVATLGTALTEDHAKILKRVTQNVVLLFDGDEAGQNAAERSLPVLLAEGLLPKLTVLPDELDPDEFVKERGAENLKRMLQSAPDLFLTIFDRLMKKLGTSPTEKIRVLDAIGSTFQRISDPRLSELYLQEMGLQLDLERKFLVKALKPERISGQTQGVASRSENTGGPVRTVSESETSKEIISLDGKVPPHEEVLLNLVLAQKEFLEEFVRTGAEAWITHPGVRKLLNLAVLRYGQNPNDFDRLTAYLTSVVKDPGVLTRHLDSRQFALEDEKGTRLMRDCLKKSHDLCMKLRTRSLINEIKAADDPAKLEQFVNVIRNRRDISTES